MRTILLCAAVCWLAIFTGCAAQRAVSEGGKDQYMDTDTGRWLVHDVNRPAPPVITPGAVSTPGESGRAPSDAIVLFDGTDLSGWTSAGSDTVKWIMGDGYMETVKKAGSIKTRQAFGSCQLHLEFTTPSNVNGDGQGRGNSGVYLMSTYEVQILDSYENPTYPDGQCSALYGRAVPLVNASLKPGEWQSYDIIFRRPIFNGEKVARKATFTVLHNGVLVQDHAALEGGTNWTGPHSVAGYKAHEDKLPLMLQDHSNPVRFRNIWIRELAD